LLETGLGGRLDATNVIDKPALTVITPVSMDHQQFLGDTLLKIMIEKVGIVKSGIPCLSSKQARKVKRKFRTLVENAGAPLSIEGQDWQVRKSRGGMVFESGRNGEKISREFPGPALAGLHQISNAGLAIAALDRLDDFHVPDSAIALGLRSVDWPARLQRLKSGPLVELLPKGWELWLDGGHNAAAAKTIAFHARGWRDKPLHLIFGMLNSKDPGDFLAYLEGRLGQFRGVSIPGEENSLSAQEVTARALDWRMKAAFSTSVAAALTDIIKLEKPARVLIAGSLYLAGSVLKENA
jgi:dihydrofolate synthase/folylpolyglutamate synthase